jgi:hypothetical protein
VLTAMLALFVLRPMRRAYLAGRAA